jgi:hypothetical protein
MHGCDLVQLQATRDTESNLIVFDSIEFIRLEEDELDPKYGIRIDVAHVDRETFWISCIFFLLFHAWGIECVLIAEQSGVPFQHARTPVPPFPALMNQLVRTAISAVLFAARSILFCAFHKRFFSAYSFRQGVFTTATQGAIQHS